MNIQIFKHLKKIFPFMFVVSKHGSVMQEWLNYI